MTIIEPLEQLAAAVEHELARLRAEYVGYGMELDLAAAVDEATASAGLDAQERKTLDRRRPKVASGRDVGPAA